MESNNATLVPKIFKVLKSEFVLIKSQHPVLKLSCNIILSTQCGALSENGNVGILPTVKFSKCLKHAKPFGGLQGQCLEGCTH